MLNFKCMTGVVSVLVLLLFPVTFNAHSQTYVDNVAGTLTDSQLQGDITERLISEASKLYKKCMHQVLKAEQYKLTERSLIVAEMGGNARELEQRLRGKNKMLVERWFMKSCKNIDTYEVLLIKSGDGADIMIKKLK